MSIPEPPLTPWLATPEDVAALLRSRTKDEMGVEIGEWTDATRPTREQVEQLIDMAASQTTGLEGPVEACAFACRTVVALNAACLVELSYFPEQVRSERSPYSELRDMLDHAQQAFDACKESGAGGGGNVGEGWTYHSLPTPPLTLVNAGQCGWRHPEYPSTWQRPCFPPTAAEPAKIDEPEPCPEPLHNIVVGHPAEGDPDRGLPPILTDP